ncbi:MAG TPA: hypothetical protein DCZ49_03900 [Hyphomonadaceae bacterium]|nr:hypothetical protein [Hyphomonadaceae bacterium]
MSSITILGAGAWGTALAQSLACAGQAISMWCHESDVAVSINAERRNHLFLGEIEIDPLVTATTRMEAVSPNDIVILAAPAQFMRAVLRAHRAVGHRPRVYVCVAKGIERDTGALMSDVLSQEAPDVQIAVLSGPSFAADVARGLPTAVTLACADADCARDTAKALQTPNLRPYISTDVIGAEIGGAVKNVLAIACGIVVGRQLGASAHAALVARGYAEMKRFAVALGARAETMAGMSGLGDLVLTCSHAQSRNMSFGIALGEGRNPAEILAERRVVTEGAATAPILARLAHEKSVEMPITAAVDTIISQRVSVDSAISDLLSRPIKYEAI